MTFGKCGTSGISGIFQKLRDFFGVKITYTPYKNISFIIVSSMCWLYLLQSGCNVGYVALSVILSFVVLDCLVEYTRNDYFWSDFDTSNTLAVLSNLINQQLAFVTSNTAILNLSVPLVITNGVSMPTIKPACTRMLMYHQLTTIESAMHGLRSQSELAYTLKRQKRYLDLDKANAAVYMEAVLRNIDLANWIPFTQGRFNSKFLEPIASSNSNGHSWTLWESYGLSEFILQYGNRVQIGLEETISIENALGQQINWTVKSIPRLDRWMVGTTGNLYDFLINDMFGVGANQSFVRNTNNIWADIDSTQIEAYNYGIPLTIFMQAVHNQIGAWEPLTRNG
ncbi:hypothetical protein THRCLA_09543 [Thraustotheca clavata]|uniref:Uncharacterized protein n=1 Tax=Thraustotheca clavata TaxID=74557 RepID=A0A1V9YVJ1_9STRA|nr:hypothetical protein THRCLA_09543 [Thraustotheca clavata]